jgi:hypothetical protein
MQILSTIALMEQSNPTARPAKSRLVSGTWRLLWSQQAEDASPLQKWGSSQSKNYQVRAVILLCVAKLLLHVAVDAR